MRRPSFRTAGTAEQLRAVPRDAAGHHFVIALQWRVVTLRDDQIEAPAQRLGGRVAEHDLGTAVPEQDHAFRSAKITASGISSTTPPGEPLGDSVPCYLPR